MRRWVDVVTSLALAVLVALSLALTLRLWSSPLIARAEPPAPVAYLAPGTVPAADPAAAVRPVRIEVALGDGRYALKAPDAIEFPFLWRLLAAAAAAAPADRLAPLSPQEVAALRTGAGWMRVEAVLPFAAPVPVARQLAALAAGEAVGEGGEGPAIATDRLALFVSDREAVLAWMHAGGALALTADRAAPAPGPATAIAAAGARLAQALAGAELTRASAARPLPDRIGGLRLEPGLLVPVEPPRLPVAQLEPVAIDADGYARSFFRDLALVRKTIGGEVTFYSDGTASLSLRPDLGGSEYRRADPERPTKGDRPAPPDAARGLSEVAAFAATHGGWPASKPVLTAVSVLYAGALDAPGYGVRFAFAPVVAGVPVEEGPPWLAARWVPGQEEPVREYVRRFVAVRELPRFEVATIAAEAVLRRTAELPLSEVPLEARRVRDVGLAYVADASGLLLPAWVVRLADGSALVWEAGGFGPNSPRYWGRRVGP